MLSGLSCYGHLLEQLTVASLSRPAAVFFTVLLTVTVVLWHNNDDDDEENAG